jgi:hypothetical protein
MMIWAAGLKDARQRGYAGSVLGALRHVPALVIAEGGGPPQRFAFGFGPVEAGLSAFNQEAGLHWTLHRLLDADLDGCRSPSGGPVRCRDIRRRHGLPRPANRSPDL